MGDYGLESEWNEGHFKSARLHVIQTAINYFKTDKLKVENNSLGVENWLVQIDLLFDEGKSKYSPKEVTQVSKLRKMCYDFKRLFPIRVKSPLSGYDKQHTYTINQENFDNFDNLVQMYEDKVKRLNDEHGLTTRNKGDSSYF